ncbi:hypothetical protein IWQ60_003335 [Tieghemiomyces parasiticus]|uniref:Uncharacterized protein n=1 Tax=Tieghemiomyces parasiticus TaxID=78921 RepID=A0A9W8ADH3_9FUNG|nr:hypothetical protein IWQ60_003335 [Tieghemiomyces parasiticus]
MRIPALRFGGLLAAGLAYLASCPTHAALTLTSTNETIVAYNLPLFGRGTPPPDIPYPARLIQVSLDDRCELTMDGQLRYDLATNATDRIVAIVNPTPECPRVLFILQANQSPVRATARALVASVETFLFPSFFDSDVEVGGLNEPTFSYYKEALPFPAANLVAVGADGAAIMIDALSRSNSSSGLPVLLAHEVSPWDTYLNSVGYAVVRWVFFSINLISSLFVAYHMVRLVLREGIVLKERYLFRVATCFFLILHFVFYMACPIEKVFTRPEAAVYLLGTLFECFAYIFLILQWVRVIHSIYSWRYLNSFLVFFVVISAFTLILSISLVLKVYYPTSLPLRSFLRVMQLFIIPISVLIEITVMVYTGVLISRSQWAQRKSGSGPMALVKLTYLCILSCCGWVLVSLFMILGITAWQSPRVITFMISSVCSQVSSILAATAIFWTLAAASMVSQSTAKPGSLTTRQRSTKSGFLMGSLAGACADTPQTMSHTLTGACEEEDGRDTITEKRDHHLSHSSCFAASSTVTCDTPPADPWQSISEEMTFQPAGYNPKIIL